MGVTRYKGKPLRFPRCAADMKTGNAGAIEPALVPIGEKGSHSLPCGPYKRFLFTVYRLINI